MAFSVRTVLVTGACRGLGLEFIKQIVALPSAPEVVIAACRDPNSASNLQDIAKSHSSVKVIKLDVERDDDIESAFKETQALVGDHGLNLLINNAGFFDQSNDGGLLGVTRQMMQKHFDVNVSAHIMIVQKFLPLMQVAVAQRGSKELNCQAEIVLMASILGSQKLTIDADMLSCLHYKCSKSASTMAGIMLARELRGAGIHVLNLDPGWVRTEMGGSDAPLSVEDSVSACLRVIGAASKENTGKFLDIEGKENPF